MISSLTGYGGSNRVRAAAARTRQSIGSASKAYWRPSTRWSAPCPPAAPAPPAATPSPAMNSRRRIVDPPRLIAFSLSRIGLQGNRVGGKIKFSEIRAPWQAVSRPSKDQRSRTQSDLLPPSHRRVRSQPTANQEKSHPPSP